MRALAERKQNPTGGKVEIEEHLRPRRSITVVLPNTSAHLAQNALIRLMIVDGGGDTNCNLSDKNCN